MQIKYYKLLTASTLAVHTGMVFKKGISYHERCIPGDCLHHFQLVEVKMEEDRSSYEIKLEPKPNQSEEVKSEIVADEDDSEISLNKLMDKTRIELNLMAAGLGIEAAENFENKRSLSSEIIKAMTGIE